MFGLRAEAGRREMARGGGVNLCTCRARQWDISPVRAEGPPRQIWAEARFPELTCVMEIFRPH